MGVCVCVSQSVFAFEILLKDVTYFKKGEIDSYF